MSSGVTDYGTEAWLSALFGISSPITGYHLALCTDQPGVAIDGDILAELEPADPDYARQPYGVGATHWALNGTFLTTLDAVSFGFPSIDWGQISHYALCTAATSGQVYAFGEFLYPQFVTTDWDFVLPPGGVVIALAAVENSIAL